MDDLTALLLQDRAPGDPILKHERNCFEAKLSDLSCSLIDRNLEEAFPSRRVFEEADLVFVGGSGEFSFVKENFQGIDAVFEALELILDLEIPMFASCFGFHAIVRYTGGELVRDPDRAELGTFEVTLNERGRNASVFEPMPESFYAQLGHEDSVIDLPSELKNLASTERCDIQAVHHEDVPILATQFHPELSALDILERFFRYIEVFKKSGETEEEAEERVRSALQKSPHTGKLFRYFIQEVYQD